MDKDVSLARYMIVIHGPLEMGKNSQLFETNSYGGGSVSVYKVLEGGVPSLSTDVKHVTYFGGFHLDSLGNKTVGMFMNEIKKGLVTLISSGGTD